MIILLLLLTLILAITIFPLAVLLKEEWDALKESRKK